METHIKEKMIEEISQLVNNINGDENEFTIISSGPTTKVHLSVRTCTCSEYEWVKVLCTHAMTTLRLKYGSEYGESIYKYSSPIYLVEQYLLANIETIMLVPPDM